MTTEELCRCVESQMDDLRVRLAAVEKRAIENGHAETLKEVAALRSELDSTRESLAAIKSRQSQLEAKR
jgi:hypothetical protein